MLFLPSAPTVSLTVPTSVGLPSLRVIQCSSRKLGTFISQSFESHGLMSQVEAEAEAEWPASVALLEAFSGLGFSSMCAASCAPREPRGRRVGRAVSGRLAPSSTLAVCLARSLEVMSARAEAGAAAPSRTAELEAQVAELTQKLERETYRSAQLAAQVKEKTRKHGELV